MAGQKKNFNNFTNQILTAHNYKVLCCKTKKKLENRILEYSTANRPKNFQNFMTIQSEIRKDKNFVYINSFKELILNLKD